MFGRYPIPERESQEEEFGITGLRISEASDQELGKERVQKLDRRNADQFGVLLKNCGVARGASLHPCIVTKGRLPRLNKLRGFLRVSLNHCPSKTSKLDNN